MIRNYENEKSYIIIFQIPEDEIKNILEDNGISKYMILNGQLGVVYTSTNFNSSILTQIPEITWWEEASPMSTLMEITNNINQGIDIRTSSGVGAFYSPYVNLTGSGILVAILDSGIDYLHPDFINEDGTSKIYSIWDQENGNTNSESQGFAFGKIFTKEDINQAIIDNNPNLSVDRIGTGTITAGIICGNGTINQNYRGIAPGVELIVVKLREYHDTYHEGRINYMSSDFLAGIAYVLSVARQENKPLIINLSIGERSSSIYRLSYLNTFTELYQSGTVLVSGAGNEGNTDIHSSGNFQKTFQGQNSNLTDVIIQVGDDINLDIRINSLGSDKISAIVISPSGELSSIAEYSPDRIPYTGRFNQENTSYEIKYILPSILSDSLYIDIKLKDIRPGIWTIRLIPEYIINGNFNIYLPNKNLISANTRFIDADSTYTITAIGLLREVITVGAYNEKTNSMWIGSSKGPHGDNDIEPDIVASGVDIISTYINDNYNTATGTGISASIVSGALALIMEYVLSQTVIPQYTLYNEPLKTYLMVGATRKDIYEYPNISQGYGIFNFQNTINIISDNLS